MTDCLCRSCVVLFCVIPYEFFYKNYSLTNRRSRIISQLVYGIVPANKCSDDAQP